MGGYNHMENVNPKERVSMVVKAIIISNLVGLRKGGLRQRSII